MLIAGQLMLMLMPGAHLAPFSCFLCIRKCDLKAWPTICLAAFQFDWRTNCFTFV